MSLRYKKQTLQGECCFDILVSAYGPGPYGRGPSGPYDPGPLIILKNIKLNKLRTIPGAVCISNMVLEHI